MLRRDFVVAALAGRPARYRAMAESHLDLLARYGTDRYGPERTELWMASLDLETRAYPESQPMARAGRRVYRDIASPRGSNIYWDVPQLAACYALGGARRAAGKCFAKGAVASGINSGTRQC